MKKTLCALALALCAAAASASPDELPLVSNAGGHSGALARAPAPAHAHAPSTGDSLSEDQASRLDALALAAGARAVLALRCEPQRFDAASKRAERDLEAKAAQIARGSRAHAYVRDSARVKYKALALASRGVPCDRLDNLRAIAQSEGFAPVGGAR